jgi:glycosyltransferase involved in cell wall biosynthesis
MISDRIEETMAEEVIGRSHPIFSLIVCTLGRQDRLRRLFASLAVQSFRDFEVIVVDQNEGGFLDKIVAVYRPQLDIIHVAAAPGLSGARNVGLAHASGRVIAFPDDDCWYDPNTLSDVVEKMNGEGSAAIVAGRTVDEAGRDSVSLFLNTPAWVSRSNYLMCGNSNGLFFHRGVFREIGRFDTRLGVGAQSGFQSGEEADIVLRALSAGLAMRYFPDLQVHHDQVDDAITDAQLRRARNYGRGFGALLRKHRFSGLEIVYRVCRPAIGAALYLLLGRSSLARYKWTWARAIAEGYRRWPHAAGKILAHEPVMQNIGIAVVHHRARR